MAEMLSRMNLWHAINVFFASHRHKGALAGQADRQRLARRRLGHLPEHLLRDIGL